MPKSKFRRINDPKKKKYTFLGMISGNKVHFPDLPYAPRTISEEGCGEILKDILKEMKINGEKIPKAFPVSKSKLIQNGFKEFIEITVKV